MQAEKSENLKNTTQSRKIVDNLEAPTWRDPETGLEWQCESPGKMSWLDALKYSKALALGGKTDWRLPTVSELETLLDRSVLHYELRPIVREEVPFRDRLSYWSSTTFQDGTKNAWIVMFDGAYVLSYYKSNAYYVRCVRP
jgi:hypothetical protein